MAEVIGRVPPNSIEAEQSILGSMLLSEDCALLAVGQISEQDFYTEIHRRIYAAMYDLVALSKPVDLVTVTERLEQQRKLSIDELSYLSDLTQRVPSVKNLPVYINIVKEKALMRQLLTVCGDIIEDVYSQNYSAQELISGAGDAIYKIADKKEGRTLTHIRTAIVESYELMSKAAQSKNGLMGISTGFPLMDKQLSGLQENQLIIIAGKTGMGKTSFALNIVEHVGIVVGRPVAVFSLEMSRDQLASRLLCGRAMIDSQKTRSGELSTEDFENLTEAMIPFDASNIYIDDNSNTSPTEIMAKLRRFKHQQGDLGLVVIDYLQLMTMGGKEDNRQLEVAKMTRALKIMARELSVPVVVLSQLRRVGDKRENQPPQLSDLRESGSIEQDADVVIFLHRDDYFLQDGQEATGRSRIIIAKQRSGPTGSIEVKWRGEMTKYVEVDYIRDEQG